jgi:hypothetical protein
MHTIKMKLISSDALLNPKRFYRGDRVSWTSSSYGTTKTKRGTVVQCVPANGYPDLAKFPMRQILRYPANYRPDPRPVLSYVVAVYRPNRKTQFYWPRESKLNRVTDGI